MNPITLQMKAIILGIILIALAGSCTWGYYKGYESRDNEIQVENAKYAEQVAEAFVIQVEYGNKKAAEVEEQKEASSKILIEVLKNVPKVTTGRECLSADAVRLLNESIKKTGMSIRPRDNEKESTGGIATDTDIVGWIASAQDQYKRCAANNNSIVDILNKP